MNHTPRRNIMRLSDKDRLNKLERMLYFLETVDLLNLKFEYNEVYSKRKVFILSDKFFIEKPQFGPDNIELCYISTEGGTRKEYIALKIYPQYKSINNHKNRFDDDNYSYYFSFIPNSDYVLIRTIETREDMKLPEIDAMTPEGKFQLSLLYAEEACDIIEYIQYHKSKNQIQFSDWYLPEFDELYEVLDATFGIGRENYIGSSVL